MKSVFGPIVSSIDLSIYSLYIYEMKIILTTVLIMMTAWVQGQVQKSRPVNAASVNLEFHGGTLVPTPFNNVFRAKLGYQLNGFGLLNKGGSFNALVGLGYYSTRYHADQALSTRGSLSDVNVAINQVQIPVGVRFMLKHFFIQSTINAGFYVNSRITADANEWYMHQEHHPASNYEQKRPGSSLGISLGCGLRVPINESGLLVYPQYNLNQGIIIKREKLLFHTAALNVAWQF